MESRFPKSERLHAIASCEQVDGVFSRNAKRGKIFSPLLTKFPTDDGESGKYGKFVGDDFECVA